MAAFLPALASGMSAKKILDFIMRQSPQLAPKITKVLASGMTADKVLSFFSKGKNLEKLRASMEKQYPMENNSNPLVQAENVRGQNLGRDMASGLHRAAPGIIGGAAALGAGMALKHALPNSLTAPQQGKTPENPITPSNSPPPIPIENPQAPSVPALNPPIIPQDTNIQQPKQNYIDVLTKHNVKEKIDQLLKSGNGPEEVSGYFENFSKKEKKAVEKETELPFDKVISEYAQNITEQAQAQAPMQPEAQQLDASQEVKGPQINKAFSEMGGAISSNFYKGIFESLKKGESAFAGVKDPLLEAAKPSFDAGLIKSPEDLKEFSKSWQEQKKVSPTLTTENIEPVSEENVELEKSTPIAKKDTVGTPDGIGEVKEIRNGKALVEVNGKIKQIPEEELQPEPKEVKDSTFDFDPESVPEELRSAPLNEVYLPQDRRHVTIKYNQGLKPIRYIYFRKDNKNIPLDYINKIVKGVQLPITSGLSFWGAWDATKSDSRGASNYEELVKNSQEEGSPDDPSKDYWFIKEESIYTHPYQEKMTEHLKRKEKEFNEKNKKPKKPKKPATGKR